LGKILSENRQTFSPAATRAAKKQTAREEPAPFDNR
jgi:hypothetical protein